LTWGAFGLLGVSALLLAALFHWARQPRETAPGSSPEFLAFEVPSGLESRQVFELAAERGLVTHPTLAWLSQRVFLPFSQVVPGDHYLPRPLSPLLLTRLLSRSPALPAVKVTFPEGWDAYQMAERLGKQGICDPATFLGLVFDANVAVSLTSHATLEGYLYPATYEFRPNSGAKPVATRLAKEGVKRLDAVLERRELASTKLLPEFSDYELLILASVVQKEAAGAAEFPLVASVFLNRLRSPQFRPAQHLQSDPTAFYGCKRHPELMACQKAAGQPSREPLRDPENPYNTYRRPGLPPTPIGNPSSAVVQAILDAPTTDYLFFFAPRGGRHQFSRSFDEHQQAIERSNGNP
jgi:UPF0755 protein